MERKLSVAERVMWMSHQVGGVENCLFAAHLSGSVEQNALRAALDLIARRHPLLRVRVEVRGITPFFVSDEVPPVPLRVEQRQGDHHWHSEAERELNDPLSMSAGPLFRVVLIKSDEQADVLFVYHHLIADGKSGLNLVTEVLDLTGQITGGLAPVITEIAEHQPLEEILPREARGIGGFWKALAFMVRQMSIAIFKRPSRLPKESNAAPSECRGRFLKARLSVQETRSLKLRCRQEHTTMHGAVCAAMLKAATGQIHNGNTDASPITLTCATPVDLRSTLSRPIKEEVGNFASVAVTAHQISRRTAFWKLATAVRDDLRQAIARKEPEVSLELLNRVLPQRVSPSDLIKGIAKLNSPIMATNLGVILIPEKFGPLTLRSFHMAISMTAFPGNVTAIIAIYQRQLEVTLCYSEPTISAKHICELLAGTIDLLQRAPHLQATIPSAAADARIPRPVLPVGLVAKG